MAKNKKQKLKQNKKKSRAITVKNIKDCLLFTFLGLIFSLITYLITIPFKNSFNVCGDCLCFSTVGYGFLIFVFGAFSLICFIAPPAILLSEEDFLNENK